jgi:Amt family ammonium transporter
VSVNYTDAALDILDKAQKKNMKSMWMAMDSIWMILCGALVMFMHPGFAMLETGSCRTKNASNVLMKNLVNVIVGTIAWWIFGWAFAYGGPYEDGYLKSGFIGSKQFAGGGFMTSDSDGNQQGFTPDADGNPMQSTMLSWFFQWAFCTAAATIVSGGVAERVKSGAYAFYSFFMAALIYPVVVAWTWGYGWLSKVGDVGYMDFAGSGIVHLTGGISALAGTVILGARKGRFDENTDENEFAPHSLPLVVFGTFCLWFGWYGFNCGSTLGLHTAEKGALAAQVATNTTISASVCGIIVFSMRYGIFWLTLGKPLYDVSGLCNGILAGLVSITAGCGNVENGSAFVIGLIGAFVYQGASMLLQKLKIDDPVDASAVHGACGIWGVLAAALFDWGNGFDHFHGWSGFHCMQVSETDTNCQKNIGGTALGVNIAMVLVICLWAGTLSAMAFKLLKHSELLRIDDETESEGMDSKMHSPNKAYDIDDKKKKNPDLERV